MQIEVYRQEQGAFGGQEVWIRVLSNQVVDLPRALEALGESDEGAREEVRQLNLLQYHPGSPANADGFKFEDWWVYGRLQG